MWELIRANKRNSIVLMVLMAAVLLLLGFVIGLGFFGAEGGVFGLMIAAAIGAGRWAAVADDNVIHIGSRRELFVDRHLIEKMNGAELRLHHPVPREVAIVHDQPWEGNGCAYMTVFQDGQRYRMYYRGAHGVYKPDKYETGHMQVTCYAESGDGVHWTKPELGLFEFFERRLHICEFFRVRIHKSLELGRVRPVELHQAGPRQTFAD